MPGRARADTPMAKEPSISRRIIREFRPRSELALPGGCRASRNRAAGASPVSVGAGRIGIERSVARIGAGGEGQPFGAGVKQATVAGAVEARAWGRLPSAHGRLPTGRCGLRKPVVAS